ncbi:MAG: sigma-70 family RNA polymerase sigma factor [Balneolaceae bacterium]|nr:sigma-70 family RNA polymerase sigma factor [Balneolaceae bacterium]
MNTHLPVHYWDKFVNGDSSAFEGLFNGYYDSLYAYGCKLCNDPGMVKDSIQTIFVSIWERRNNLKNIKSPNSYMFVALRQNILKAILKKDRETNLSAYDIESIYDIDFSEEEIFIRNEIRKDQKKSLLRALNQLSNRQKEVLYLHYFNGMSYAEIEEILSINRQSVRNHMFRAMQALRAVLDLDVMRLVISFLVAFQLLV